MDGIGHTADGHRVLIDDAALGDEQCACDRKAVPCMRAGTQEDLLCDPCRAEAANGAPRD